MPDWIERKDDALCGQAKIFSQGISADPAAFGATPEQAAELAEKFAAFEAAYLLTLRSSSDCTVATLEKNETRESLVDCMRARARTIRAMPSVTPSQRVNLHMSIAQPRRTRIPRPGDTPAITLGRPDGRSIPLRVQSTLAPTRRGLPSDVAGVQIFCFASIHLPPVSDTTWRPLGTFTKSHVTIDLNLADIRSGDAVWIVARYVNAKAQPGNWSGPVCTYALGPALMFKDLALFSPQAA